MKIYAFVCTRDKNLSETTERLLSYLSSCNVDTKLLVGAKSIFSGYAKALKLANPDDEDIVILCHDDIEILSSKEYFAKALAYKLVDDKTGFVGVAGTTHLSQDAVWWNHQLWSQGKHRGLVFHGNSIENAQSTYYGQNERVVVLDGLFLASKAKVLRDVGLEKPEYLEEAWDFYDIHYTYTANEKGYNNYTIPIFIMHNSFGDLAGRDSWHKNRLNFINKHNLPKEIK